MDKVLMIVVPLVALLISAFGLLANSFTARNSANRTEFDRLCARVKELEDELKASQAREKALMQENLDLLRTVASTARCPLMECPNRPVHLGGHPS